MILKEAEYKEVKELVRKQIKSEVHGCDECFNVIDDPRMDVERLQMTIHHKGDIDADYLDFCSWDCCLKHISKINNYSFISFPYISKNNDPKRDSSRLIELLKTVNYEL